MRPPSLIPAHRIRVLTAWWLLAGAAMAGQPDIDQLYRQASQAYSRGDNPTAKTLGAQILGVAPKHIPTKDLLSRVATAEQAAARTAIKPRLAAVTIDKLSIDGITFKEAVGILRTKLRQQEVEVNLLIMDPAGKIRESEIVGLDLNQIPATTAIEYLAEAVGATAQYRADSVVFAPK